MPIQLCPSGIILNKGICLGGITASGSNFTGSLTDAVLSSKSPAVLTTITLPASPTDGTRMYICDGAGLGGVTATISGNGNNINGSSTYTVPFAYCIVRVVFSSSAGEWIVVSP